MAKKKKKERKHHGFYFERILSYYLFPVLFWSLKDFLSESDNHLRLKKKILC